MKLLILGGTVFVGKHLVEAALARGHEVTLFNRGKSRPSAFPEVEQLRGERDGGLNALSGRTWDAVIDTCGYVPRIVRQSVQALAASVGHYTFISSISVYVAEGRYSIVEGDPVASPNDPTVEEVNGETYGGLKVLGENEATGAFGHRALIVRPGLIVGPDDPTDRFTYWPVRFARGGQVVVPDRRDQPLQIIDVRDLSSWTLSLVERGVGGVYNATGPAVPYLLGDALATMGSAVNPAAELVWTSPEDLETAGVKPWVELPLYLGASTAGDALMRADVSRAVATGLTFRPLTETTADTLAWASGLAADRAWKAGLSPDMEVRILKT